MQYELDFIATATHHTTHYGSFIIHIVKNPSTQNEHVVLVRGDVTGSNDVLCRVASECLPGTVLYSADCECKQQLDMALEKIDQEGLGILILLRQEGRGHGLAHKIRALSNKNAGYDTFTAVEILGDKADIREYWEAAYIISSLRVLSVNLMTNNPDKISQIENIGIKVSSITSLEVPATRNTIQHLQAKKSRGHLLNLDDKGIIE